MSLTKRYNEGMSTRTKGAPVDYYTLLGVASDADETQVRRAYRELARRLHPDVNKAPDAAARFAVLADAYAVLSDPDRRRAYDLSRHAPPSWGGSGSGIPDAARQSRQGRYANTVPPVEPSLRGLDVEQTVRLTLREAAFGTDKTVTVARRDVCQTCHGNGAAPDAVTRQCPRCHGTGRGPHRGEECERCLGSGSISTNPCASCHGSGRVAVDDQFALRFPPAVDDGEVLRIRNQGDPGPRGGPRGDLRLTIAVEPDPVLRRRGGEVYADVMVTPRQAADGDTIEAPTLHGPRRLRLPPGVADGTELTMRHQGLRLKGKWARGDQHVTVHIREQ